MIRRVLPALAVLLVGIVGISVFVFLAITKWNPGYAIQKEYPGAGVSVHHWTSSGSLSEHARRFSPYPYIGPGESIAVSLKSLKYPVRFDPLTRYKVVYIYVVDCRIADLSALLPPRKLPVVMLDQCDLSSVPPSQQAYLRKTWDDVKKRFVYCLGDL